MTFLSFTCAFQFSFLHLYPTTLHAFFHPLSKCRPLRKCLPGRLAPSALPLGTPLKKTENHPKSAFQKREECVVGLYATQEPIVILAKSLPSIMLLFVGTNTSVLFVSVNCTF